MTLDEAIRAIIPEIAAKDGWFYFRSTESQTKIILDYIHQNK